MKSCAAQVLPGLGGKGLCCSPIELGLESKGSVGAEGTQGTSAACL